MSNLFHNQGCGLLITETLDTYRKERSKIENTKKSKKQNSRAERVIITQNRASLG